MPGTLPGTLPNAMTAAPGTTPSVTPAPVTPLNAPPAFSTNNQADSAGTGAFASAYMPPGMIGHLHGPFNTVTRGTPVTVRFQQAGGAANGAAGNSPTDILLTAERVSRQSLPYLTAVPKHVIDNAGDQWTEAGTMVSSGPYRLESWEHDQQIVLVRNEYYGGTAPAIER